MKKNLLVPKTGIIERAIFMQKMDKPTYWLNTNPII